MNYNNFVIIISAPSGAGKSTIIKQILEQDKSLKLMISATTRAPRGEEKNGVDYFFLTKEEFEKKIENNEFVEYAEVHDNYYGTLKSEIENNLSNSKNMILDIDFQGSKIFCDNYNRSDVLKIFILPPSFQELERRLRGRGTDTEEVIQKRLNNAKKEIEHCGEYDYVVVNDDLDLAIQQVKSIIESRKIQNIKNSELNKFIAQFK